jgi:murein L,D-transpeptidase YcbB/YkuD
MQVIREPRRRGLRATAPIRAAAVFLLLVLTDLPAAAQDDASALGEILSAGAPPVTDLDAAIGPEALAELKQAYAARNDRPIWLGSDAARALIDRLAEPNMVLGPKLRPLLDDARKGLDASDAPSRAGADLRLTALYGATAQALRPSGPAGFAAAMAALGSTTDLAALLREPEPPPAESPKAETPPPESPKESPKVETPAIESPKVETPPPAQAGPSEPPAIARLRAAITALQPSAAPGWPLVPAGAKLQRGDSGARVEALSRRLIASGDLKAETPGDEFDLPLKTALEHFQARHGLPSDGVAGAATIAALNVPLKDRLAALNANLQRLEREGRDWGDRYLVLNIPAAAYRRVEGGRVVAEGPAILGAPATPTPPISGMIDRVLLHPAWRIPQAVAERSLWPLQEEDATYFYNHGIRVTDDGLRQVPGPNNPLGPVKLLIAGNDRIALHGTPNGAQAKSAFDSPERFTSLGCMVLPDIAPLAKVLLAADPAWPEGRIDGMLAVGGTETVTLAKPLPLHVVYETAWVDEDGTLEFRGDVYGWDKQMPAADPNTVAQPCGS